MSDSSTDKLVPCVNWREVKPGYLTVAPNYRCLLPGGMKVFLRVQMRETERYKHQRLDVYVLLDRDYALAKIHSYLLTRFKPITHDQLITLVEDLLKYLKEETNRAN